jgi:hypothetical protein
MDVIGGLRLKRAWVAWPGKGLVPPSLVCPLGLVSLTSCAPGASCGKILTPKKS